jgi:hypothetical protein
MTHHLQGSGTGWATARLLHHELYRLRSGAGRFVRGELFLAQIAAKGLPAARAE